MATDAERQKARRDKIDARLAEADRLELAMREMAFWVSASEKPMGIKLRVIAGRALATVAEPLDWSPPRTTTTPDGTWEGDYAEPPSPAKTALLKVRERHQHDGTQHGEEVRRIVAKGLGEPVEQHA